MTVDQLAGEFERAQFAGLAENTVKGPRAYLRHLKAFFGESRLSRITVETTEKYRTRRRAQPTKTNPNRSVKRSTVNRDLECLKCVSDLAVKFVLAILSRIATSKVSTGGCAMNA
jgi:hypothetical protein